MTLGSAREQAAMALQHLGVGAVLAQSFGRIFYRNALNFGIPALLLPADMDIRPGDELRVDVVKGEIHNARDGHTGATDGLPPHLLTIVRAGGLMPYLKTRLAEEVRHGQ